MADRKNLAPFLKEYIATMKQLNMEKRLGLFLIYQDLLPMDFDKEILYEITDTETRQQVIFITTKEQVDELKTKHGNGRMINTHWTVYHDAVEGTMFCCPTTCCSSHSED